MDTVELRVSFLPDLIIEALLASVRVERDTIEPWGDDHIRRTITATVEQRGEIWDRWIRFWSRGTEDVAGRPYLKFRGIQVEHDFYPFFSMMSVSDFPRIRLLVVESFDGSAEEYYDHVRERNAVIAGYHAAWNKPGLTRNDVRELTGLPRLDNPALDTPVPLDVVTELRELDARIRGPFRNMVI